MSQQENGAPPRPPSNSYPEPHAYPSPQMQPSYTYPPPQGQSSNEPYRQSPTASTMPPTNLNLPPIRGMDGQSQMPAQPPGQQTSPPIPPAQPMPAYSYVPPPGQPMIPGQVGAYPPQRYPLPAQNADARMMSGGRHKKEIKRRTKTGCLTCRKRRIKCDEQHPKCRNCIKSKRECMGYDPIFKQQHNPSQLQPAPSAPPSSATSVPSTAPTPSYPPTSATYHPVTNGNSTTPVTSAGVKPDPSQPYEFNSAIDPALAGGDPGTMASTYPGPRSRPTAIVPCKIEDLWYFQGQRPNEIPPNTNPLPPELLDEIRGLYKREFAPGCSNIFETDWYKEHGSDVLMANTDMCQAMAELIKHYKYISTGQNVVVENKCRVFETMVVWRLLSLCRLHKPSSASEANGDTNSTIPDFKLDELNKRLDIMEALLTNVTLPSNPLADFKYPEGLSNTKLQQIDFWKNVGTFVSTQAENPDSSRQIETALGSSRNLLAMNENRDVIYSIMICRHLGRRFQGFPDHLQSRPECGELDDTNKVFIARDFITSEANWKGTTHPIQRVCDMAIRSWAARPAETA